MIEARELCRHYAMGGETEFAIRMEQLGHKSWFVPGAVVEHVVRGFQMERAWVLSRAVSYGRGQYRRDRQRGAGPGRMLLGMPRWRLSRMCREALSPARATLSGDAKQTFHDAWMLRVDWGYISEARVSNPRWSAGNPRRETA